MSEGLAFRIFSCGVDALVEDDEAVHTLEVRVHGPGKPRLDSDVATCAGLAPVTGVPVARAEKATVSSRALGAGRIQRVREPGWR